MVDYRDTSRMRVSHCMVPRTPSAIACFVRAGTPSVVNKSSLGELRAGGMRCLWQSECVGKGRRGSGWVGERGEVKPDVKMIQSQRIIRKSESAGFC